MTSITRMHIALIRGINVGGRNTVAMADLRALVERLGFAGVKSLLQSGNLVFQGDRRASADVERLCEKESATRLAIEADFFVRSAAEWKAVVAENPFPKQAAADPAHLVVHDVGRKRPLFLVLDVGEHVGHRFTHAASVGELERPQVVFLGGENLADGGHGV